MMLNEFLTKVIALKQEHGDIEVADRFGSLVTGIRIDHDSRPAKFTPPVLVIETGTVSNV